MLRIVVVNPKGGSGKTTIAINLASYFAVRRERVVLMDQDPQGSTTRWFRKRGPGAYPIQGVAAWENDGRTTRTFRLRIPPAATRVVIDTPAAMTALELADVVRDAHKIVVPVLPSDIDVHACTRVIADLLLVAKIRREENRIGVVANRVRRNTLMYQSLQRFLATLNVPVVATLNAARVAVACERHRQKTGVYPEKLDDLPKELLPEVPNDPFTGKPILYKKLDDGAVTYSASFDGVDDGAKKLDAKNEKGNDIGFRLWTLDHRRKPPQPKKEVAPGTDFASLVYVPDPNKPKPGVSTAPPPLSPWVRKE